MFYGNPLSLAVVSTDGVTLGLCLIAKLSTRACIRAYFEDNGVFCLLKLIIQHICRLDSIT